MERSFKLRNLDCASCAQKIESVLEANPHIKAVRLSFATSLLVVTTASSTEVDLVTVLRQELAQICSSIELVEDGVDGQMHAPEHHHDHSHQSMTTTSQREIFLLAALFLLLLLGIFLSDTIERWWPRWGLYLYFIPIYLVSGHEVLVNTIQNLRRRQWLDENFLMTIASIGALLIQAVPEAASVMLFYRIGEFFQALSVARSRRQINQLLALRPDVAYRKDPLSGELVVCSPEKVAVGELIVVRAGEKIPLDGEIVEGVTEIDASLLTGESIPMGAEVGSTISAGTINLTGRITVRVTRPLAQSSVAKMVALIEEALGRKAPAEKFITLFARYYTPSVVTLAVLIAFMPPLIWADQSLTQWIYRALVILVVSCPCALVVSIPLTYFTGIGLASRQGILVKGANFLEMARKIRGIAFDKTGTLTRGQLSVERVEVIPSAQADGWTTNMVLEMAAFAEFNSYHPMAQAIKRCVPEVAQRAHQIASAQEVRGQGVQVEMSDGRLINVGNERYLQDRGINFNAQWIANLKMADMAIVYVAVDRHLVGTIALADQIRPEAAAMLAQLREQGVEQITLLSGDRPGVVQNVADQLGIRHFQGGLLPEEKLQALEQLMQVSQPMAFVGDGMNDAPVLARASVGIAMGEFGTDAAIESADVVLMSDSLLKIPMLLRIARKTHSIVVQNIVLALGIKILFIFLGSIGVASMWEAVFGDVGVAVLAILNSFRVRNP